MADFKRCHYNLLTILMELFNPSPDVCTLYVTFSVNYLFDGCSLPLKAISEWMRFETLQNPFRRWLLLPYNNIDSSEYEDHFASFHPAKSVRTNQQKRTIVITVASTRRNGKRSHKL